MSRTCQCADCEMLSVLRAELDAARAVIARQQAVINYCRNWAESNQPASEKVKAIRERIERYRRESR